MTSGTNVVADPNKAGLNEEALRHFEASIQSDIDNGDMFGASVIVARGGVIGYRKALGTVAPGRRAVIDDLYLAMSVTKSFTAALVLRAIDEGRFALNTRVSDIIPEFAAAGKKGVTIHQLLTHTAGTYPTIVPPPMPLQISDLGDLAKTTAAYCAQPAAYTPGTRCVYTQLSAIGIAGQLLVVTDPAKRSFRDIARQDLFEPLGMTDTRIGGPIGDPRRVFISYTDKRTTPASAAGKMLDKMFDEPAEIPAGNAYTTVDDLFRFAEILRQRGDNGSYRLLSQSLLDYATQNHSGDLSNGAWDFYREEHGLPDFPANFSLLGGYSRGTGHFVNGAGVTASPRAFYAMGGGSTMWMVDPERDLTFAFLSAGFIDGLAHLERGCRLSDLALAACVD
jgi:CubicO group peptidase (beta-lactamase class C family)